MVDTDNDGNKETYKWLSMSYILANDETTGAAKTTLENLAFTFRPVTGEDIAFSEGLNNVPVQRNWRTNIIGDIMNETVTFNIVVDPKFDNDHNYYTEKELAYAFVSGGEITLDKDLELTKPLVLEGDKVVTIGGIYGTVTEIKDASVLIEVDNGVKIRVSKQALVKDFTEQQ